MKSFSFLFTFILSSNLMLWACDSPEVENKSEKEAVKKPVEQQPQHERKKPPTFADLIKKMDKDEDGKLSKTETKGPLNEHFEKVDLDKDGFITEEEFNKAPKPNHPRRERNG